MPHVMGPIPGPPPPTPHEVRLLAEIARLSTQLNECRAEINELAIELADERILHQHTITQLTAAQQVIETIRVYERSPMGLAPSITNALAAYDATKETPDA